MEEVRLDRSETRERQYAVEQGIRGSLAEWPLSRALLLRSAKKVKILLLRGKVGNAG